MAVAADGARRLVRRRRKGQPDALAETTAKVAPAEPVVKEVSPEVAKVKAAKTREAVAEKGQAAKARTPKAAKTAQTEAAAAGEAVANEVKAAGTKAKKSSEVVHDDLTAIKGIGPTFAKRLNEAGYSSYADIAMASADALREATHAPAVANPDEWIEAAREKI